MDVGPIETRIELLAKDEVGLNEPMANLAGIPFKALCDDILLDIFKYLSLRQRVAFELVNSRLGILMPMLNDTLEEFRYRNFSGLSAREEELYYIRLVKKSPRVKQFYFELLRQEQLLVSLFSGEETVESYTRRIVEACTNCEEIRLMIYTCNEFSLYAAVKVVTGLGVDNRIKKIHLHLDYSEMEGMKKMGNELVKLVQLCPCLVEVEFDFYGPYDGGEWSADALELANMARDSFDAFWLEMAARLKKMTISYNDADMFFGHKHWTSNTFVKLEELKPHQELTGGYIRNIVENMPVLRKLAIETNAFEPFEHLISSSCLEELSWSYFAEESCSTRDANKRTFDRFLRTRGKRLKKLELKIPFQQENFFSNLSELCPNIRHVGIHLSGTTKRPFQITSLTCLPRLRKVSLACKLAEWELNQLLISCPKLTTIKFYIPSFEKSSLTSLKANISNYAKYHPLRKMVIKIRFCGGSYFNEFDQTLDNNCIFYIDNGRQLNDYWEDD